MDPKEKALRLCQKFGSTTLFAEDCNNGYTLPLRIAKICATIAVDEIIEALDKSLINADVEYFKKVKTEIQNL